MACYRLDHQPPDLTSEIQTSITPKTFLNMVEEFTKMEDIVLLVSCKLINFPNFSYFSESRRKNNYQSESYHFRILQIGNLSSIIFGFVFKDLCFFFRNQHYST